MKKRILFLMMIAAALTFSCQKAELANNDVVDNGKNEVVDFVPGPGKILAVTPTGGADTKVAFGTANEDGSIPVVWVDKDAIKVYSENDLTGAEYTFEGTDASSAVFTGAPVEGETRYAVYPATRAKEMKDGKVGVSFADLQQKQLFHSTLKNNSNNLKYMPMWAKETPEGVFTFENLCGAVAFRFNDYQELRGMKITNVTLTSKSVNISGWGYVDPATGELTLNGSDESDRYISVNNDKSSGPYDIANTENKSINDAGKTGFIMALPVGTYPAGDLTVTITDNFGRVFERVITSKLVVRPGELRTFPTLSFTFSYGDDNCLTLAPDLADELNIGAKYTFAKNYLASSMVDVKDADGNPYGLDSLTVDVAWEILENGTALAEKGSLISVGKIEGNKVKVTGNGKRGNALVVLKDTKGTILWSWHIWVVKGNLKEQTFENLSNKPTFHNLNLGATTGTFNATNAIGLYYQYGRKDPFVIAKAIARPGSPYVTGPELTQMTERTNDNATVSWSIKNPDTRIIRTESVQTSKTPRAFADWCLPQGVSEDYWGPNDDKAKTIYDPCPEGYKVPSSSAFAEFSGGVGTEKAGFLFNASNYTDDQLTEDAYKDDPIGIAYFPYAGAMLQGKVRAKSTDEYTSPSNTNSLHMYRWRGWYWTTEIKFATESRNDVVLFLDNSSSTLLTATATRASANNIRCVKMDSAK